jgi:hypothetical protein
MNVTTHPWNRSFERVDHRRPLRVVTEAQAHAYDELGYFVLEGTIDADTRRAVGAVAHRGDPAGEPVRRPVAPAAGTGRPPSA